MILGKLGWSTRPGLKKELSCCEDHSQSVARDRVNRKKCKHNVVVFLIEGTLCVVDPVFFYLLGATHKLTNMQADHHDAYSFDKKNEEM